MFIQFQSQHLDILELELELLSIEMWIVLLDDAVVSFAITLSFLLFF